MAMKNNARMNNVDLILQAGFDPKTGLPRSVNLECNLKNDIRRAIRIIDEQDAVNRYKWYNLPNGLNGHLIERILYYKGQAMFFYNRLDKKFYFLPYALSGTIDIYGRFNRVQGLPFNGTRDSDNVKGIEVFTRDVIYDIEDINKDSIDNACVLLHDYVQQQSQTNISRSILNEPVIDAMAESFPMARTSLIANSGVKGMRVNGQDEQAEVINASRSVTRAALTGNPWIPIISSLEFQDLTSAGSALKSEEYLVYLQALDNFRLSLYGLKSGGLFQKKSHMLESEQEMNESNTLLVYKDGLTIRQRFCDFVNSIWGLGIWCEECENMKNDSRVMQEEQETEESKNDYVEEGETENEQQ